MGNRMGKAEGFVLSRRGKDEDSEETCYKWVAHSQIKVPKNIREQYMRECRKLGEEASRAMVAEAVFVSKEGYLVTFGQKTPQTYFPFTALDSEGKTVFLTPFSCKDIIVGDSVTTEFVRCVVNSQHRIADAEAAETLESMAKMNALTLREKLFVFEREVKTLSQFTQICEQAHLQNVNTAAPHVAGLVDELVQLITSFSSVQQPDTSCIDEHESYFACLQKVQELAKEVSSSTFYKEAVRSSGLASAKRNGKRVLLSNSHIRGTTASVEANVAGLLLAFARLQKVAKTAHSARYGAAGACAEESGNSGMATNPTCSIIVTASGSGSSGHYRRDSCLDELRRFSQKSRFRQKSGCSEKSEQEASNSVANGISYSVAKFSAPMPKCAPLPGRKAGRKKVEPVVPSEQPAFLQRTASNDRGWSYRPRGNQ